MPRAFLLGKIYGAPVVYVSHDRIKQRSSIAIVRMAYALNEYCMRRMSSCVSQGKFTHTELLSVGVAESAIHRFKGCYRYFYETACSSITSKDDAAPRTAILYVGRIEKNKGVLDLIIASAPILNQQNDLQLVYAGNGDASVELQKLSKELDIEDKVTLLGEIPYSEIPALMASAKVLVTPTQTTFHEGHRHAMFEGFMFGLPVIAPSFGPYPHYINDNVNGLLYQPDSFDDLAKKLASVLNDDNLYQRLSNGALEYSESIIDPEINFSCAIDAAFAQTLVNKQCYSHPTTGN